MKITIITLFPEMFESVFAHSILKRAQMEGKLTLSFCNLRDFGIGKHKMVDDTPYGGGTGMILKVDVVVPAIESVKTGEENEKVILLDPVGIQYKQTIAEKLSSKRHLILVCGHYEGFDARIRDYVDMSISLGDYILSGGEIAAMVITESVSRLIPGVLSKEEATDFESFSEINGRRILEFPQYTRPLEFRGKVVPELLRSGNQKLIAEWREKEAIQLTKSLRPELINKE